MSKPISKAMVKLPPKVCLCRIKRYAIVEIDSGIIMSQNALQALLEFDNTIDFDLLLRNAAGEGGIIRSIQWSEDNHGAEIDIIDPNTDESVNHISMDEDTITKLKETFGNNGVN